MARSAGRLPTVVPHTLYKWYYILVNGIYQTRMGDRGRLVIPAALRAQAGLGEGAAVVLIATPGGVLLVSREQLKSLVREDLAGLDLVAELLAGRRRQAAAEDAA
jgi:AbrB family looped-hinge helix DNA binding protein